MHTRTLIRMMLLIALLTLGLTACTNDPSPDAAAPPIDQAAAGPVLGTLELEGSELEFQPAVVQVDQPGRYAVTFANTGHTEHDWVAAGTRLLAKPGETVSGEVVVPADGLEFVCSFPGHAAAGMRGKVTVNAAANNSAASRDGRDARQ